VHVFALAQLLERPIVLLDSVDSESSTPATFLPVVSQPEARACGIPLFVAWSSAAKNHFVPLCPVLPRGPVQPQQPPPSPPQPIDVTVEYSPKSVLFPAHVLPPPWGGVEPALLQRYFVFDTPGNNIVVSPTALSDEFVACLCVVFLR
jgi:hypothetical protein